MNNIERLAIKDNLFKQSAGSVMCRTAPFELPNGEMADAVHIIFYTFFEESQEEWVRTDPRAVALFADIERRYGKSKEPRREMPDGCFALSFHFLKNSRTRCYSLSCHMLPDASPYHLIVNDAGKAWAGLFAKRKQCLRYFNYYFKDGAIDENLGAEDPAAGMEAMVLVDKLLERHFKSRDGLLFNPPPIPPQPYERQPNL